GHDLSMRPAACLAAIIAFVASTQAYAASAPANSPGLSAYVEGLDGLMQGRWPEAAAAFSRALDTLGDDPTIVLARGVAYTLSEQFPQALKDLDRAKRLGLRGRETELWTYVTEAMSGIVGKDHALGGFQGRSDLPAVVSIPGHIVQGRDDYPTEYGSFLVYQLAQPYQKFRLPDRFGGLNNPAGVKNPQTRQVMLKAGQMFAERYLKRPELASVNVARAKQSLMGKDYDATLRDTER